MPTTAMQRTYPYGGTNRWLNYVIRNRGWFFTIFMVIVISSCQKEGYESMLTTSILQYKLKPLDIFIKNDDSIAILGYTSEYKLNNGYVDASYIPIILKSNDGGVTWSSKSFAVAKKIPRFFLDSGAMILYNFESKDFVASIYLSNDGGESWGQIGEQELSYDEQPVFENFITEKPDVNQINKVSTDRLYVQETPSQVTFVINDEQTTYPSRLGYISRFDGKPRFINACGYNFSNAISFVNSNAHRNVWVFGKCSEKSFDKCGVTLIRSSENDCTVIASWQDLTSEKFGGDSPKAIFVSEEIIAVVASGAFWYGKSILRYSLDGGLSWKEEELPDSKIFKLSYDSIKKTLNIACASILEFSYIKIPVVPRSLSATANKS